MSALNNPITGLDFVGIPTQNSEKSLQFYTEVLGLEKDTHGKYDLRLGNTCLGIWEPESMGMPFAPQKNAHLSLHVEDIEKTRAELEAKGVVFQGDTFDTGVCYMALFTDPDGNDLMLHHRYAAKS